MTPRSTRHDRVDRPRSDTETGGERLGPFAYRVAPPYLAYLIFIQLCCVGIGPASGADLHRGEPEVFPLAGGHDLADGSRRYVEFACQLYRPFTVRDSVVNISHIVVGQFGFVLASPLRCSNIQWRQPEVCPRFSGHRVTEGDAGATKFTGDCGNPFAFGDSMMGIDHCCVGEFGHRLSLTDGGSSFHSSRNVLPCSPGRYCVESFLGSPESFNEIVERRAVRVFFAQRDHLLVGQIRTGVIGPNRSFATVLFQHVLDVVTRRPEKEVVRSHAWWVVAVMTDIHSRGDRPVRHLPGDPMREIVSLAIPEATVTDGDAGRLPYPAAVPWQLFDFGPKPFFDCLFNDAIVASNTEL